VRYAWLNSHRPTLNCELSSHVVVMAVASALSAAARVTSATELGAVALVTSATELSAVAMGDVSSGVECSRSGEVSSGTVRRRLETSALELDTTLTINAQATVIMRTGRSPPQTTHQTLPPVSRESEKHQRSLERDSRDQRSPAKCRCDLSASPGATYLLPAALGHRDGAPTAGLTMDVRRGAQCAPAGARCRKEVGRSRRR